MEMAGLDCCCCCDGHRSLDVLEDEMAVDWVVADVGEGFLVPAA